MGWTRAKDSDSRSRASGHEMADVWWVDLLRPTRVVDLDGNFIARVSIKHDAQIISAAPEMLDALKSVAYPSPKVLAAIEKAEWTYE